MALEVAVEAFQVLHDLHQMLIRLCDAAGGACTSVGGAETETSGVVAGLGACGANY